MNRQKIRQQEILIELGYVAPFYCVGKNDVIYSGYRYGNFYFSTDWSEARQVSHPEALQTLKRWYPELDLQPFYL